MLGDGGTADVVREVGEFCGGVVRSGFNWPKSFWDVKKLALNRSDATCVSVHDVAFADRDKTEVPNQPVEEGINEVTNRAPR